MTITAGTRLGPYEVSSRIGAGGMGEVWKARDTRLERNVAIKVLPADLAHNTQFTLRFEREAKTISQLNHPHICTLYDVGDGYLVMELIEGESLADRLTRGALLLSDVLKFGEQIADALDRAHRAGVVHRDLKPGNIMLTRTGAKLLDFGLAKSAVVDIADGATMAKPLTQEGTILGTFQYMAPEQLEGTEADARTDIFALGAVLYEMATGSRAFAGKTKTSLIAAIVKEQPRPISEVVPLTPPALEHIVSKCLAKDPEDRWQSARDVAQELRWVAEAGSQARVAAPVMAPRRNRERLAWILAAGAAVAATMMAWRATRLERPRVMRFSAPNTISSRPADTYGLLAVSPDGGEIVYSATAGTSKMLFRRAIDQFEVRPIPGSEGGVQPFFSPDGKWVGFFAQHKLLKVPLSGGRAIEIAHAAKPRGAEWLEDGTIVLCPFFYGGIERVSASGGSPTVVSIVDREAGEISHRWPHALPGGKVILYTVGLGGSWDNARVVAHRLDTGARKVVVNGGIDGRYVPTGHLVYVRGTTIYAVAFDPDTLETRGQPFEVAFGVANHSAGGAEFAFSRNGILVYFSPGVGGDEGGRLVLLDRQGQPQPATLPDYAVSNPAFSPDGASVAGTRDFSIWTFDLARGTHTRTASGPRMGWPAWSADGRRLFYASERTGPWQIASRAADGSDEERQVSRSEEGGTPADVSPDGKELLTWTTRKDSGDDIDVIDLATGTMRPFLRTDADEGQATFSPDGQWIAYGSDETGRSEVYVRPRSGAGRWRVSNEGGTQPRWARAEIAYLNGTKIMAVSVKTSPTFSASTPRLLLDRNASDFDIARDGRILIVEAPEPSSSPGRLNVVVNWFEEIRAR